MNSNFSKTELSKDPSIRRAVTDQTAQWSRLVEKQKREERELMHAHLEDRRVQLCKLCAVAQQVQQKQLTARHESEIKEMNARQARLSIESTREVMNDKTLKTRGIKEGRLREKQQNNTKKFMEERKIAQIVQKREKETLKSNHEKQLEQVQKEMNEVSRFRSAHCFVMQCETILYSWLNCLTRKLIIKSIITL